MENNTNIKDGENISNLPPQSILRAAFCYHHDKALRIESVGAFGKLDPLIQQELEYHKERLNALKLLGVDYTGETNKSELRGQLTGQCFRLED